ncbi:MAG: hypothetical protein Kow00107_00650 [Planctomycetota bacterium]
MKHEPSQAELDLTFRVSIIEAVFAAVFVSIGPGSVFFTKLLNELGAGPMVFSVMAAIGPVASAFLPLGVAITKNLNSRKTAVVAFAFAGRALAIGIAVVPVLLTSPSVAVWMILAFFFASTVLQGISNNAWTGWIADNVPLKVRGKFFSIRSQYSMIFAFLTGMLFSVYVDLYDPNPGPVAKLIKGSLADVHWLSFEHSGLLVAICAVFIGGGVVGMAGSLVLLKQPEAPKERETEPYLRMLLQPLKDRNFLKLLFYALWWMLAVGIGAPFWQPYMLNELKMSLTEIQLYGLVSTTAAVFAVRVWGRVIDAWGNKPSMIIAVILGGLNPIVWIWADGPDTKWIVFIEAATSGIMWCGTGVITANFVLAVAPADRRQMYSGLYGTVSGLGAIVTMLGSGIFLTTENMDFMGLSLKPEQIQFGLGGVARWTALIPLSFVYEPTAKPVGQALYALQQFAKVRIANLLLLLKRKGGTPPGA